MTQSLVAPPTIHFGGEKPRGYTTLVDLTTLKETRLLLQGTSGAGKTTALYGLVQQTYGLVQHIIIDKEGSFPKLREEFDYLLVGADGEVPINLDPGAVEVVIRKILETRVNAIIDLSDLVPRDQHEYVRRVAHMMAHLSIKSPLAEHDRLVIIDELQHFGPEMGRGTASSTEALIELGSLGRKRGFCLVGATTRVSLVSKSIVEILDNKMIGRCGADDAKRAAEILNFTKADRRDLLSLPTGQFYAYGPAISTDPVLVRSADDLIVLPPRRGERRLTPETPAAVRDVLDAFADVPRESKAEAQTMDELRTQVTDLTKRLRKAEKGRVPDAISEIKTIEVPVVDPEAVQAAVVTVLQDVANRSSQWRTALRASIAEAIDRFPVTLHKDPGYIASMVKAAIGDKPVMSIQAQPSMSHDEVHLRAKGKTVAKVVKVATDGVRVGKSAQAMIDAIGLCETLGNAEPTRQALAGLTGISNQGTLRNVISELRRAELIEDRLDDRVALTTAGRARALKPVITSAKDVHEMWLGRLGSKARIVLAEIIRAHPRPSAREYLQRYADIENAGTFRNVLSEVRRLGLIDDVTSETVKGSAMLFPEGLK